MKLLKIERKNLLINIKKLKTKLKTVKAYFKKTQQDLYLKMIKMEAFESDKNKCRHLR